MNDWSTHHLTRKNTNLRIAVFRILALGGAIVSAIACLMNFALDLSVLNGILCGLSAVFALALLFYSSRTGNYRFSIILTIISVFFIVFTVLFFSGGGYKSGMPSWFILAIVFTAFMLDGALMAVLVCLESLWYVLLCMYEYYHPETVIMLPDERALLIDTIIAFTVVACVLGITTYLQITMYRNNQEEILEAREEALAANRVKTDFLANMSHDIRTPLNTVMAMNELIAKRTASQEILGYTYDIRTACTVLLAMIGDLLDLSRIESGHVELSEGPWSLPAFLHEEENTWKALAEREGLSFRIEADAALPSVLSGSLDSIRKIVNNLVGNAVKYTNAGSVVLKFSAVKDEETKADAASAEKIMLRIEVRDTGIGISEEDLKRIFLPFERGSQQASRIPEGTGLGLSIVRYYTEAMGGSIRCESRIGEGSCFTAELPQGVADAAPIGETAPDSGQALLSRSSSVIAPEARILVVDDNEYNRKVLISLFRQMLVRADDVESGPEALEMLEIRSYDLVLMDIMMPGMDGTEALRLIREQHLADGVPVVALTADAMPGTRERLIDAGFAEYLTKPIGISGIEALLQSMLPTKVTILNEPGEARLTPEMQQQLRKALAPYHIDLDRALEIDGGAPENLRMRASYFAGYRDSFEDADGSGGAAGRADAAGAVGGTGDGTNAGGAGGTDEKLFHLAHSLKSSANSIGAVDLADLSAMIERRRDDPDLAALLFPALKKEYERVAEGEALLVEALDQNAGASA